MESTNYTKPQSKPTPDSYKLTLNIWETT